VLKKKKKIVIASNDTLNQHINDLFFYTPSVGVLDLNGLLRHDQLNTPTQLNKNDEDVNDDTENLSINSSLFNANKGGDDVASGDDDVTSDNDNVVLAAQVEDITGKRKSSRQRLTNSNDSEKTTKTRPLATVDENDVVRAPLYF
jgi:hypothetical protein